MAIFLGTSFVIALEMARDNQHKAAAAYWQGYLRNPLPLLTTDLVFTEIVTFFDARGIHVKAVEVGERLLRSQLVEVVNITSELHDDAWAVLSSTLQTYLREWPGKRVHAARCLAWQVCMSVFNPWLCPQVAADGPAHGVARIPTIASRTSAAQARRLRPCATCNSPNVITTAMPGVHSVRQSEPSSVSSSM